MKEREALKPKEVVKEKVEEAIVHEDEWGKLIQLIKKNYMIFINFRTVELPLKYTDKLNSPLWI